MKRLITLSLAVLMVMGLSTVAFAVTDEYTDIYSVGGAVAPEGVEGYYPGMYVSLKDVDPSDDDILVPNPLRDGGGYVYIQPSWTAYYMLASDTVDNYFWVPDYVDGGVRSARNPIQPVTVADAVKSVKVTAKYRAGNDAVDSMKIEYKKAFSSFMDPDTLQLVTYEGYSYFLAIKIKDFEGTGFKDFGADVTLKKTSGADAANLSYSFEMKLDIAFRVRLDQVRNLNVYKNAFQLNASSSDPDSEETIEFPGTNGVYFEVNLFAQGRTILAMNLDFDAAVIAKYPAANLDFYNGNGALFNRDGILVLPAEPGTFLYVRDAEGNLQVAENAVYDSAEEAFHVTTKVLGQFVVSDIELDLEVVNEPTEEPAPEDSVDDAPKAPVDTGAVA